MAPAGAVARVGGLAGGEPVPSRGQSPRHVLRVPLRRFGVVYPAQDFGFVKTMGSRGLLECVCQYLGGGLRQLSFLLSGW